MFKFLTAKFIRIKSPPDFVKNRRLYFSRYFLEALDYYVPGQPLLPY